MLHLETQIKRQIQDREELLGNQTQIDETDIGIVRKQKQFGKNSFYSAEITIQ
jgi:hypothetical protein